MGTRSKALLCAAGAVGLLAAPAGAQAFKDVSETASLTTTDLHTFEVRCPGKQRVLGGGQTNDAGFSGRVAFADTAPFDAGDRDHKPDDGWTVSVDNSSIGTVPVGITAEAICAKGKAAKSLRYRKQTESVDLGNGAVEATCGRRKRVVSGGISSPAASYSDGGGGWITSTAPADGPDRNGKLDDAWEGRIDNYTDDELPTTTYAVCAKGKFGRKLKRSSASEVVEQNTEGTATATCPGRTKIVGGGLQTPVSIGDSIFNGTGPLGRNAWIGAFDHYSADVTVTAHAICHK